MLSRDYQNVGGCLGVDVTKGQVVLVGIDLSAWYVPGNDFAEQTVVHFGTSFEFWIWVFI